MGKELAEVFAKKGYQVVVETHNDTDNLHNHLIINPLIQKQAKNCEFQTLRALKCQKVLTF